ncbi:AroM family protein [Methylobacterium terricola]|uniref:AroM family protein n=1 Tax=Methylobacterium terricola TaxID=2583531 RepID=A0A5C4L6J0_9HYPH|nr:AroM family protein [Methylobacterium terricola]TNC07209.1 AroM family protein [Methylobacterium terricola]
MGRTYRLAFVTIGQSPRIDMVPEMLAEIGSAVEAREYGVLDDASDADIAALHPTDGEASFASRLRDGREAVLSKAGIEERLSGLLSEIDRHGHDAIVLLCTGTQVAPLANTLLIESQRIVDATVEALAASCPRLGVMVPLARQVAEFPARHVFAGAPTVVAASPYAGDAMAERAAALADRDLIVMHCMGYTEAMRREVRAAVAAPVLLSRRIVAGAVRQLL